MARSVDPAERWSAIGVGFDWARAAGPGGSNPGFLLGSVVDGTYCCGCPLDYHYYPSDVDPGTVTSGRVQRETRLIQNTPNPFNGETKIELGIASSAHARLRV